MTCERCRKLEKALREGLRLQLVDAPISMDEVEAFIVTARALLDAGTEEGESPLKALVDQARDLFRPIEELGECDVSAVGKWLNDADRVVPPVFGASSPEPCATCDGQGELVRVCSACKCAACWQGRIMCEMSRRAGTVLMSRKALAKFHRELSNYHVDGENPGEWTQAEPCPDCSTPEPKEGDAQHPHGPVVLSGEDMTRLTPEPERCAGTGTVEERTGTFLSGTTLHTICRGCPDCKGEESCEPSPATPSL